MVFASLLFIYLFLPLNLICVYAARTTEAKNIVMLIFSLIFYAFGGPKYLLLLLLMTGICWSAAILVENNAGRRGWKNTWLIFCLLLMLGLLCYFKYTNFFLTELQKATGFPSVVPTIALPIGISFYTFQLISYVVDVYRGEVNAQRSYGRLLLYAGLFHQCIAGPIVRYADVEAELESRTANISDVWAGIQRFSIGLAKKAVFANHCAELSDALWPASLSAIPTTSSFALVMGAFYYMLQIYLDFSAYSDMAIGMGRMMGIHYLENFNYPYIAASVTEFWRRWHISLSSFFRDYVYIPLGGNRKGKIRTIFNLFIVWMLTGFWHGAAWNFMLWGLYYFVFLMIEKLFFPKKKTDQGYRAQLEERIRKKSVLYRIGLFFRHIYLLVVVFFGWILFKSDTLTWAVDVVRGIFCDYGNPLSSYTVVVAVKNQIFFLIAAILAVTPLPAKFGGWVKEKLGRFGIVQFIMLLFPAALLILSTMCLVGDSYNPFLYFRF